MKRTAFTMIEIMLAIAILLTLVALSLPNILRSRSIANEGIAVANLRIISDACHLYRANMGGYPADLNTLGPGVSTPPYIDSLLAGGRKQGYEFIYNNEGLRFTINANPVDSTVERYYFIDESGTIRVKKDAQAGREDEVFQ